MIVFVENVEHDGAGDWGLGAGDVDSSTSYNGALELTITTVRIANDAIPSPQPPVPSPASSSPAARRAAASCWPKPATSSTSCRRPKTSNAASAANPARPASLPSSPTAKPPPSREQLHSRSAVRQLRNSPAPTLVLAADTVAECDGFILGKPRDEADARAMLTQLSGREHRVLTGVCLWPHLSHRRGPGEDRRSSASPSPSFGWTRLTDAQLDEYLASGQWEGKAGAFGYQDRLGWVHIVEGSESNVVGLPMELLAEMLGGDRQRDRSELGVGLSRR